MRIFSERSPVPIWLLLASASASCCLASSISYRRERSTFNALSLFLSCDFSSWQEITIPVGICVRRTAESVVLTHCPPFPDARNTSNLQSFISRWKSISSASGIIATVQVDVWIRPPDSVSGTRCTRCTPLSYFRREYAPCPWIINVTSLNPPIPFSFRLIISVFHLRDSAYFTYIR